MTCGLPSGSALSFIRQSKGYPNFDLDLSLRGEVPNLARVWAYNYRDAGRTLRAEFEADPTAALSLGDGKQDQADRPEQERRDEHEDAADERCRRG